MKNIILPVILILTFVALNSIYAQNDSLKGKVVADGVIYGNDLSETISKVEVKDLITTPEKFEKQNIEVQGSIKEVCQNMGCWMMISDGQNLVKIMTLHKFFFPKDLMNNKVIAQGEFTTKDITDEDKKHYEDESGKKWKDVYGDMSKYYIIKTSGVKVINN
jgi:hypothetical protein